MENSQKLDIVDVLNKEAHLLDQDRFHEWLDLFSEDAMYIVPLAEHVQGDVGPAGHPIVRDNKEFMKARVLKHETGFSHSETPRSVTRHLVTNIYVEAIENGIAKVSSTFLVRQARGSHGESWWAGAREDTLRLDNGSWKIVRRVVTLDAPVLPQGLSIFF